VDCTLTAGPTEHGLALYSDAAAAAVLFAQCLSEFVLNRPLKTHVRMERESDNDNRKLVQTVQQQRLVAISLWIQIGHVTIFCLMLTTVRCRTDKIQCLVGLWLCARTVDRRQLRSSDISTFVVPRTLHSSWRSGFSSCWTAVVEQHPVQTATVRPYSPSVLPNVKDVFVWLTETPAPSDFCS